MTDPTDGTYISGTPETQPRVFTDVAAEACGAVLSWSVPQQMGRKSAA